MSEYTPEDFKNARFAEHADGRIAMRAEPETAIPWHVSDDQFRRLDAAMARDGWTPVVESRITEHTLEVAQSNAERRRQKLLDHIADQDRVIRRRNDEIERLIRDNMQVHDLLRAPLTLDTLREAWEQAEAPTVYTPIRKGDILICKDHGTAFDVWACETKGRSWEDDARILRRAPQPEPWQALADVLRAHTGEPDPEETAQMLHERGVRVTGGDEA